MQRFDKNNIKELSTYIYNSCTHDAIIEKISYKHRKDCIIIELFNSIFNVKINFAFCNVDTVLAIKGKEQVDCETIISLTLEDDLSYLKTYLPMHSESVDDSLYLLFQMLSGGELHIVAKEVFAEITR